MKTDSFPNLCSRASHLAAAAALVLGTSQLHAAGPVMPISYDMPNGYGQATGGSFNYWDKSYNGIGDTSLDYAPLSGGLGDLTDGIIPTENWLAVENVEGTGPYVGWNKPEPWLITFNFGQALTFETVTVHFDDADGLGDISPPATFTVMVNGSTQTFNVTDPVGAAPNFLTLTLAPLTVGTSLVLGTERFNNGFMLSEVQFTAAPIPEPGTWLTLGLGLGVLALRRRRQSVEAA